MNEMEMPGPAIEMNKAVEAVAAASEDSIEKELAMVKFHHNYKLNEEY